MKRFLILTMVLICLTLCVTALADTPSTVLSEQELASLTAQYTDYSIISAYRCDAANVAVTLHKAQGRNLLVWLRNGQAAYAGTSAIPQGYPVYLGKDTGCSNAAHVAHLTAVQADSETGSATENGNACHYYLDSNGELRLGTYRVNGTVILLQPEGLTYDGTWVGGTVENRLAYIDLSRIPQTLAAARKKLSNAPEIPEGTLSADCVQFAAGQCYAVYSAPDKTALRGANGKALVSTNDWVQVFGRDDQWIMVQYDIASSHFRIGYIPANALPTDVSVPSLDFTGTTAVLNYACDVTDDPLNSQTKLISLPAETNVLCLGTMGSWSYVEGSQEGVRFRGFLPTESLTMAGVVTSLEEAKQLLSGTWMVYAGGADRADTLTFSSDGSLCGQFRSNGSYAVSPLAMVTGHEDQSDWNGTWQVVSYNAALNRYWNDPEFELSLTRNNETHAYGMRICWEPYGENGPGYALILSDGTSSSGLVLCK